MRRTSYQKGSLKLADRKKRKVWEFRWREVQIDGSIRRKNIVIGTLGEFPNESTAQAAVDALRLAINKQTPQQLIKNISLETLVNHYREHELPDIFKHTKPTADLAEEDRKSYATQVTYNGYLQKWILPRWGSYRLLDIKAPEVEQWLKSLCFPKTSLPLARGSKAKVRNVMSALFSHAIRWEWAEKNPITSVRQSSKRQKAPDVLTAPEIMAILKELAEPLRTMIELDAFTGLRRGELIGLRWEDTDFDSLVLHVRRSVVAMVEGAPKTEASQKEVPLDAQLAQSLWLWKQVAPYSAPGDWVFGSPHMKGTQPYWPGTLWRYYGRPAVLRAKIKKRVSYHTFRHTFGTLLNANGENPKVVQELLRHASLKVTTDVYMQAMSPQKREAQSKLVKMVMEK
ncbi:MAG: tyrosine-type recombinase/integrase [Acidobacteria bacterium]|nr:tyrosine-type recombinase/integrase [Acidobacteriota bacterium]MBI3657426.1 tyrosine-type recombinase/integrase [Acidobacteriota bacterium]